jgi:hypothetical protein
MPNVIPARQNVQVEDVKAEAAASEGTMTKIAGSVNFWNEFYSGPRQLCANGIYDNGIAPETLVDGLIIAESACEIGAIACYSFTPGTSGVTQFDLILHRADGGPSVSIFATRPAIPQTADHNPFAYTAQRFTDLGATSETLFQSTGTTIAVLNAPVRLEKGDSLTLTLVTKQVLGANCGVQVTLRPINE